MKRLEAGKFKLARMGELPVGSVFESKAGNIFMIVDRHHIAYLGEEVRENRIFLIDIHETVYHLLEGVTFSL